MSPTDTLDDKVNAIGTQLAVITSRFTRMDQDMDILRAETRASTREAAEHHEAMRLCIGNLASSVERITETMFTADERHALKGLIRKDEDDDKDDRQIDVTVRSSAKVMKWTVACMVFSCIISPIFIILVHKIAGF